MAEKRPMKPLTPTQARAAHRDYLLRQLWIDSHGFTDRIHQAMAERRANELGHIEIAPIHPIKSGIALRIMTLYGLYGWTVHTFYKPDDDHRPVFRFSETPKPKPLKSKRSKNP